MDLLRRGRIGLVDTATMRKHVKQTWDAEILPSLVDFITIPSLSPAFDPGYAACAAIEALLASGGRHAHCVLVLETSEESGSPDLPAYLEHLRDRLGDVSLVVCLDSGGYDYNRLCLSTSLRGLASAEVTVAVVPGGLHSGMASGVVPSSFRIMRALLDRLEDTATGRVLLPGMHVDIPADRLADARALVESPPGLIHGAVPVLDGMPLADEDAFEVVLQNTSR